MSLCKVSVEEWMNIPEIGDYSIKKQKRERFTPTPDNIIGQQQSHQQSNMVQDGMSTNLNEVGMARSSLLTMNLDKFNTKYVMGQSNVDKEGYLTSLNQSQIQINTSIDSLTDFKKARLLLKSVIQCNPDNTQAWIALARLEELDGRL